MFYSILDKKRLALLPLFKNFKKDFYLAGGTGLSLQFGHRDSVDFDFFTFKEFDTKELFKKIKLIFKQHKILKVQEEKNTLTVYIDNDIQISFFTYPYNLNKPCLNEKYLKIASIGDIGCMKLSAITGRASNKDYIDLYFILQKMPLNKLLKIADKIIPELDRNLILKSLVYFDDIEKEPIKFKGKNRVSFKKVEEYLMLVVKKLK